MKQVFFYTLLGVIFLLHTQATQAQCTQYDPNSIYVDLEDALPCGTSCGTPTVTSFEIWSNEAYLLGVLQAGSEYDFTLGASTGWSPTITVAAWDTSGVGAVVDHVDGRFLSITIPSDGEYILILSETGSCNGAASNGIDNGALSIDCGAGGATCSCLGITLTLDSTGTTTLGGTDGTASVAITGGSGPYSVDWSNGDSTASLSGLAAGTYSVTIVDNNGCSVMGSTTVVDYPASISMLRNKMHINFQPNPSSANTTLMIELASATDIEIQISNLMGQVVYQSAHSNIKSLQQPINTSQFAAGTYFVEIRDGLHSSTTKLVVQK